jgi:hypothetical protein
MIEGSKPAVKPRAKYLRMGKICGGLSDGRRILGQVGGGILPSQADSMGFNQHFGYFSGLGRVFCRIKFEANWLASFKIRDSKLVG